MSEISKRFNVALCTYITETLGHIETVRTFCKTFPKWMEARKTELGKLNKMLSPESKHADLEKELDKVLKNTLDGLQKLDLFLDAVEKLAVTSLNVFTQNQAVQLPKDSEHVQVIIIHAKLICPLLLEFKRDAKVFFLPKLQNVEVLKYQFDRYIQTSKRICDIFEKSISVFALMMNEVQVNINMDLPESDIQDMLCRINQLNEIRMDPNFRMVFLFQEKSCSDFIKEVQNRQPRMRTFLQDLEQCAIQLDRMNKGAKISSITGSSVGAVGGVLSIVGLALSPVTAGVSLGLFIGGTAMGILSGTNSAVTTFTELAVNRTQENKVNEVFQKFMQDMQSIQDCLGEVISQPTADIEAGFYKDMCSGFKQVGSVGLSIRSLVKDASDVKLIKSKNLITGSGKMVTQESKALSNASKMASEIPEVSQAAFKGSLALSKTARAGAMALNALFLGMDIYSICQDSISLAKANKTETSQFIRARASLWSSEIDSWQKICDSLNEGLKTSDKRKSVLEMPFYPEIKRQERDRQRVSVSFENKQRDREPQHKRELYLFIVVLGGLLGFAAWVCDTFSN